MAENIFSFLLLLGFGFVMGVQHGIDLDHIAAIADIASAQPDRRRSIWYAAFYGLGHGIVVSLLGVVLIAIGQSIPQSLDRFFGKIVGITLILLGMYVFYSIYRHGRHFKMKSRWMLIFDAIKFGYHRLLHNFDRSHKHAKGHETILEPQSAFTIGMIHGVGAETPTQIAVLAALLGIGKGVIAMVFLLSFVFGIFIANVSLAAFLSFGIVAVQRWNLLYLSIGFVAALFSLIVGIMFVTA